MLPVVRETLQGCLTSPAARTLAGAEGNAGAHGLLLNGSGGAPEFPGHFGRRGAGLRQRLEGLQLRGAPAAAVVRGTFCHFMLLQAHPTRCRAAGSYTQTTC